MYPVIADPKANSAHWAKVEKDFEAAHPGTRLTIEEQPWENRDEKLATAFGSGKGPDVVLLNPDQVPQYLASGALRPVDKAVEGIEESFLPNALKALSDDGKLYAVPIYHTVTTTLYNKRLLDRAGIAEPPATWDEVRAAAPKLKRIGVAALDYSASNEATLNLNFYPLLWQAGGRVFSEDGRKAAFNGPEGVAALTFLTDLYKAGALPRTALTNTNIFADHPMGKQQAAMGLSHTLADADLARRPGAPRTSSSASPSATSSRSPSASPAASASTPAPATSRAPRSSSPSWRSPNASGASARPAASSRRAPT